MSSSLIRKLRLLYIQPAEVFGGAERQGLLQMKMLAEYGFEVFPVIGPGKTILPELAEYDIHNYIFYESFCHEAYYPLTVIGRVIYASHFAQDWVTMQMNLVRAMKEMAIDLVFANRSTGWIASGWAAHHLQIPLVWRGGGRITKRTEAVSLSLFAHRWGPDALICNCEAVRENLRPFIHCPSYVVKNGVDHHRFNPQRLSPEIREDHGIDDETLVVGFPSRPAPEKGLEFLAQVVKQVRRRVPKMKVLIAGEFGWRTHYEKIFAQMGLSDQVKFIGHLYNIESFYRGCDVVVLTSKDKSIEGSPNVILEAMAMECPIVATQVGGVAEAIRHGVEGFLVPPEDVEGFAHYLEMLLLNSALRKQMGASGRATILNKFNHQHWISQLANILRGVALKTNVPSLYETDPAHAC